MTTTFQSAHGKFLCAESGGGSTVIANRDVAGPWETWSVLPSGEGLVCLCSDNGHFLRCEGGGGSSVDVTAKTPGPWENYRLRLSDDGLHLAFQTWDGLHFLTAELDGTVVANRTAVNDWEVWKADPHIQTKPQSLRKGRVRLSGRSFADDGGHWLGLGSSLFWAVRGAAFEPDRVKANLSWLADRGVDFVRVFADTCDWAEPSRTDPRETWWEPAIHSLLEMCKGMNLRVWWTIFGSNALTSAQQWNTVQDLMTACDTYPEQIQGVEISNEGIGFQDTGGFDRIRAYASACRVGLYPVTLSSAAHIPENWWTGSAANVGNEHFERTYGENGWRYVRQPWGYWDRQTVPKCFVSLEPCGIGSSVVQDTDVNRQIMAAVTTWLIGGAGDMVHTGAGIYGVPNHNAAGGDRPANVWEQPTLEPILAGIAAQRKILPVDLSSYDHQNAAWAGHPYIFAPDALGDIALNNKHGATRSYATTKMGGAYAMAPIGVMGSLVCQPKTEQTYTVYAPDGTVLLDKGHGLLTVGEPAAVVVST